MSRKSITLVAGVVVLAGLSATCVLLKKHNEKAQEDTAAEDDAGEILSIDLSELAAVSFDVGERRVCFNRIDDAWELDGDETFPVDTDALETALESVSSVSAVRRLEQPEGLSEYGLDEPQNVITIKMEDGTEKTLTVGATNDSTGDDYMMLDGDDTVVYTVSSGLRAAFSEDLYEYAVSEELPYLQAADIVGVSVENAAGGYELYLEDAVWKAAASGADGKDADSEAINDALAAVTGLSYSGYLEHNCTDASAYGLDEPSSVLTFTYTEDSESGTETEAESESEPGAEPETGTEAGTEAEPESESETEPAPQSVTCTLTFYIGDTDESGDYYVQMEGSAQVHTISSAVLARFLEASAADWVPEISG